MVIRVINNHQTLPLKVWQKSMWPSIYHWVRTAIHFLPTTLNKKGIYKKKEKSSMGANSPKIFLWQLWFFNLHFCYYLSGKIQSCNFENKYEKHALKGTQTQRFWTAKLTITSIQSPQGQILTAQRGGRMLTGLK